ncbi:MAG: helix-hairpin-helix domain-containing protein [Segetibacter sp.]
MNTADTSALISLPGIGSKLAARIVNFREKLGGFSSVNQLGETYGIPDSTFQKIKPQLQCNHPALKTININTADINVLRAHPYLRWNIANAIINYRQQHGNYKSVEDIRKIDLITDDLYNKIAPYLVI